MPHLIGPDFIGIQGHDLDAARKFYTEVVGLTVNHPRASPRFTTRP